jgi:integrase
MATKATTTTKSRAKKVVKVPSRMVDGSLQIRHLIGSPFTHTRLSVVTKKNYEVALQTFMEDSRIDNVSDLLKLEPKQVKRMLTDYIIGLKDAGLSYSKQNMAVCSVQKLFELNDVNDGVNWKSIRDAMSDNDAVGGGSDEPYTREQLRTLVEAANPRTRALILVMLSSGIRIGAVPGLQLRDLQKMDKFQIYRIEVYSNSKRDRYFSFTTPECRAALDAYLQSRQAKGEILKPDSPLFRGEFSRKNANTDVKGIGKNGVFKLIEDLAISTGIRKRKQKAKRGYAPRHQTPLCHSFRKLANSAFVKAGIKPVVCELLLGHDIGLQKHYLRLTPDEMAAEYVKSIDELTVSTEKQLQEQVDELQTKVADFDTMKRAYLELKQEKEQDEGFIAHLQEAWEEDRKRQAEEGRQLAEAVQDSQKAVAELREMMERKLRERESSSSTASSDDDDDDDQHSRAKKKKK